LAVWTQCRVSGGGAAVYVLVEDEIDAALFRVALPALVGKAAQYFAQRQPVEGNAVQADAVEFGDDGLAALVSIDKVRAGVGIRDG
jgi:hypothetical protein